MCQCTWHMNKNKNFIYDFRYVVLILDKMKIQEDLVYDKTGNLLGFVNLGHVNEQLLDLEKCLERDQPLECFATHILTLMVRGIFFKLEFPFASFPTTGKFMHNNTRHACLHEK